jgi:hypothetical protein
LMASSATARSRMPCKTRNHGHSKIMKGELSCGLGLVVAM